MVETIIFIRHAGNLWNIFNSSLIPPTQFYHAKILSFVLLQYYEILSCLKAKTYLKTPTYSFSLHHHVRRPQTHSKTAEIPLPPSLLLCDHPSILAPRLLYPLSLDGFTSSKLESAMWHFLRSTHEQETQVGIISSSTQATWMGTFFLQCPSFLQWFCI